MYGVMGLSGTVRSMVRQGGVRSLWRSNGVSLFKLLPDSAIRFFAYEKVSTLLVFVDVPFSIYYFYFVGLI